MAIEHTEQNTKQLGLLLVEEGFINSNQLQVALKLQEKNPKTSKNHKYLGQILIDKGYISADQLHHIMNKYHKKSRLGDILLRDETITEQALDFALKEQKRTGERLGDILLKKSLISDETLRQALSTQLNIPYIDISRLEIDPILSRRINRDYAFRHKIIPISMTEGSITLAMDDPTNSELASELEMFTRLKINIVTSSQSAIKGAFSRLYPSGIIPSAINEEDTLSDINVGMDFGFNPEDDDPYETSKPQYIKAEDNKRADMLVQQLLAWALKRHASDIHLENLDRHMVVRFRVDGLLQEFKLGTLQDNINRFRREIISRIKVLCKLDIAERRLPQDGSFRSHVIRDGEKTDIDFRVSVIPSHHGENIVIRILDSQEAPSTIEHLDFSETLTKNLTHLFKQNTGIILITGPTGSGKSTTLQSGLLTAYRPGLKVVTAEDPIEYVYDNFMQCEINEKIGLTFASYIRVFLRHDPEIIMIGEIRDGETAEMAIRAAQTGHLVLSTLHTNDSLGAISRLSGLGINPSMISSSLIGVVSQRLARKICPQCAEDYTPEQSLISEFFTSPPTDINWQKGIGCEECNYTGYKGRVAIAELWEPSQHDILLINKQAPLEELKLSTRKSTIPLIQEALQKLREGKTTLDELVRIIPYAYIEDHRKQLAVKG